MLKFHSSIIEQLEKDSMKLFSEELFSEWKNMYGSEGLGWLTSIEVEYNEEKNFIF